MIDGVDDLASRWARARRAAASAIVGPARAEAAEPELLACAAEVDEVELHRRLFENGARLGEGYRRFHRKTLTLAELPEVLPALGVACLQGSWELAPAEHRALRLIRPPCREACDARHCDAWREAIDGLVVGLTDGARHTRVASRGHGQPECVDVLTMDPESPLRWGELPEAIVPELEAVQRFVRMFKGADVQFLGVSEGVLLYRLDTTGCGDLRGNAREMVEQTLAKKLPHLTARELSPRPVLETD